MRLLVKRRVAKAAKPFESVIVLVAQYGESKREFESLSRFYENRSVFISVNSGFRLNGRVFMHAHFKVKKWMRFGKMFRDMKESIR